MSDPTPAPFNLLDYRHLHEAAVVMLATFAEAEKRHPDRVPVKFSYETLIPWVRVVDRQHFGTKLDQTNNPRHLMQLWVSIAAADGVVHRTNIGARGGTQAIFALTSVGRHLARLPAFG